MAGGTMADCGRPENGLDTARASGAADGRTILLEDGRKFLLAGLEVAPAYPQAATALAARVTGRSVTLRGLARDSRKSRKAQKAGAEDAGDRHGRLAGFVFVEETVTPLQDEMLRAGLARAAGPVDTPECWAMLLASETAAREGQRGLWADPAFGIRPADRPAAIAERGRFAIVEGKILSVRENGGTIYLNFGKRWSEDFTATIPKRLERQFAAAGLAPQTLAGRIIRIRGIVEERGGPWIEAARPDQIELTER